MLRDPAKSKQKTGHRPGSVPLDGPFEVRSASGTSVELVHSKTGLVRSAHAESLVYLRTDVADYEQARARRAAEGTVPIADDETSAPIRRTPGQLMQQRAPAVPRAGPTESSAQLQARVKEVAVGRHIAFRGEALKRCRVGEVVHVNNDARSATVRL